MTFKLLALTLALIMPIALFGRDHCCRGHGYGSYWGGGVGVSVGYGPMAYYTPQYLSYGPYPVGGWGW